MEARMLFTMFLLAQVYLVFLAILGSQGAGTTAMLAFVGIFMLIPMTVGTKTVSESEEPELNQMIPRLCAMVGFPKPKIDVVKTPMPNAFDTDRNPAPSSPRPRGSDASRTRGSWRRSSPTS